MVGNISFSQLAPIVLFVYNRPVHTARVLQALSKNKLSSSSMIYVFSDGPCEDASENDYDKVHEVRRIVNSKQWCGKLEIIETDYNRGLADSIISGVTEIVERHRRVIVLEDDIVTSPFFLSYMNDALNRYEDEKKVMHVAAYMPSLGKSDLPDYFFMRNSSCWGWATWQRAWCHFNNDPMQYLNSYSTEEILRFNLDGAYDFWGQLQANKNGTIKTWAVYWYASVFRHGGLCLHPRESFTENIGFDGSGIHCNVASPWSVTLVQNYQPIFPDVIQENELAEVAYRRAISNPMRKKTEHNIIRQLKSYFEK